MMMKALACVALLAACGSKSSAPTSTTTTPTGETAKIVLPENAKFDELDHDQKIEFMKQKVMPAMEPIFKNHDPKEFVEFGCVTCHGPKAKEGEFHMPSDALPKLNFKDMSKYKPEDLKWMGEQVKPAMAKLLGEAEYTPENPTGFGCAHCHTTE